MVEILVGQGLGSSLLGPAPLEHLAFVSLGWQQLVVECRGRDVGALFEEHCIIAQLGGSLISGYSESPASTELVAPLSEAAGRVALRSWWVLLKDVSRFWWGGPLTDLTH